MQASYSGTAETFIDGVVMKSCHNSLYNNPGYYSESGSCSSSHHSLILEDPVLTPGTNGRSSYSHQSNFIKLIVKEASESFLDSNQIVAGGGRPQLSDHDSLDEVQIVIGHAEEERMVLLRQDSPVPCGEHPSSTVGCPTPRDLTSPVGEKSAPEVRGLEVARLEDDPALETGECQH